MFIFGTSEKINRFDQDPDRISHICQTDPDQEHRNQGPSLKANPLEMLFFSVFM